MSTTICNDNEMVTTWSQKCDFQQSRILKNSKVFFSKFLFQFPVSCLPDIAYYDKPGGVSDPKIYFGKLRFKFDLKKHFLANLLTGSPLVLVT